MAKPKRKLTAAEKRAKKERKKKYQWIFIHGKQVRVRRPPTIDGLPPEEFIAQNADALWLHQNEMWELITPEPDFAQPPLDDQNHSTRDVDDCEAPRRPSLRGSLAKTSKKAKKKKTK